MTKTIYAYGVDQLLINAIKEAGLPIVAITNLPDEQTMDHHILLLNGEDISLEQAIQRRKTYSDKAIVAYIDPVTDMRQTVVHASKCSMNRLEYFSYKSTPENYIIQLKLLMEMNIDELTRIIGFFGSGTGAGTTTVSHCFAQRIAAAGKSVVHLGLDVFDPGWEEGVTVSLDVWRPKLAAKIIHPEDFKTLVIKSGVSYLPGNFDYLSSGEYKVDEINYLLDKAQEHFDVVVADFGSIVHSAAWYVGMQRSAHRILVTHVEHHHRLRSLLDVIAHMNLDFNQFFGIVNKYNSSSGYTAKDLERNFNLAIIAELPTYPFEKERTLPIGKRELTTIDEQVRHLLRGLGFEESGQKRRVF